MDRFARLTPHAQPLEDDNDLEFLIRQALAAAAIAQANSEKPHTPLDDEMLSKVVARVTPTVLDEVSSLVSKGYPIGEAAAAAVRGGLLPKGRAYTDEELEL
jgi:hypothetical protein